uniref:Uncharacterized protein n=1 Tax=Gasterosteus aculeatus TaxID=69293 RepID=G3QCG5_GASAC
MLRLIYKICYKHVTSLISSLDSAVQDYFLDKSRPPLSFCNMPFIGQCMLACAASPVNHEMLHAVQRCCNTTPGESLQICQTVSGFVPILLPYKRKPLKTHAIPKNCPIYFFHYKKMPLNILQQETRDIHRLVPAEVVESLVGSFC